MSEEKKSTFENMESTGPSLDLDSISTSPLEAQVEQEPIVTDALSVQDSSSTNVALEEFNKMPPSEQQKIYAIVDSIDVTDTQAIIQYGSGAQSGIAGFSDTLLREVKTKDTGYVSETLSNLMVEIKNLDVDGISSEEGFFDRLFGGVKRRMQKFKAEYEKVAVNIDAIVAKLDRTKLGLFKDIKMLDALYEKNLDYLKQLDYWIMAGRIKMQQLQEKELPALLIKAQESGDQLDAQQYKDMQQMVNRFEKKLYDLELSRTIAIQTGPQIRIIQSNDQTLAEKIQSSIMNTIPLWKSQMVIAISLFRQEGALKLQQEVTQTTNDLLTKNSELLKENSIKVAKESEKGIVEIETLKKVHNNLIQTIEETIQIQRAGHDKRVSAEQELGQIESELKQKLIETRDM